MDFAVGVKFMIGLQLSGFIGIGPETHRVSPPPGAAKIPDTTGTIVYPSYPINIGI
jgi:hypothetical protein